MLSALLALAGLLWLSPQLFRPLRQARWAAVGSAGRRSLLGCRHSSQQFTLSSALKWACEKQNACRSAWRTEAWLTVLFKSTAWPPTGQPPRSGVTKRCAWGDNRGQGPRALLPAVPAMGGRRMVGRSIVGRCGVSLQYQFMAARNGITYWFDGTADPGDGDLPYLVAWMLGLTLQPKPELTAVSWPQTSAVSSYRARAALAGVLQPVGATSKVSMRAPVHR